MATDPQLLATLRAAAEFLHRQGVGDGAAAVDEIARWVELYGDAEGWAKRAQDSHARAERAELEVIRLRQGLWDCAAEAGEDHDGDTTPAHMTYPDIVDHALRAVRELRHAYEEGF